LQGVELAALGGWPWPLVASAPERTKTGRMDYRILGPLEVCQDGRALRLGGDKQRALLAILLLHAGEVVSSDRLIDGLWGERPPPTALKALQVHVSRLRRALDRDGDAPNGVSDGVLVTRGHGYLLRVGAGELDLDRFCGLVEEGRKTLAAGDADRAAGLLADALGLWRGPPLADLAYEAFAQRPIAELEELRLGAVEERVEADLALGRHQQLVGELRALVDENPLRERLRGELMLALYRCGREAEALEVYQEFRRGLAEELGLDPSPRLQRLEAAILERDPSLDAPAARPARAEPAVRGRSPRRSTPALRRRQLALAGLVLSAVAVAAAVLVSLGGGSTVIAADSVGALSASSGSLSATVPVGSSPSGVAAGDGAVWVANYNVGTVSRIDEATHALVQTIPEVSTPSGIAIGFGAVWVANNFDGTVTWINPAVNRVVKTIKVGNGPSGVAVGDGSVWVTNSSDSTLSRINPITGAAKTIPLGGDATDLAAGYGAVWVSDEASGRVLRVDPRTDQVTEPINVGNGPTAITVGFGSVWVANSLGDTVSRINPQTNQVQDTITVGNGPNAIAAGAGGVWVANEFGDTVARINPATNTVAQKIAVGSSPRGLAVAGGLVWVSAQASPTRHRGGTLVALQNSQFGSLDPTNPGSTASVWTLYMTNDGLVAFKRVGGSDGAQIVPDLAVSVPTPADGGLTYTFQLRRGIRYSDGQPVKPEDFRRAIERDLELYSPTAFDAPGDFYEGIVGAAGCVAQPSHCDLSRGIVTGADTVTFRLTSADPEFLYKLALWGAAAVPAASPDRDVGRHARPATGPYEVASDTPRQVVLVRNPYFHEWSHAAQPDGYPDRIVWRIGAGVEAATTAVEQGRADYTLDLPADRLDEVQTRFTSQLHVNTNDETLNLSLNDRTAPFNDITVRRALNYAVDRTKVAQLLGQDSQPTCQLIPPYINGYQRYCPYTLNPNSLTGAWSAPDLPKARALIAASGTRGTPITIWSESYPEFGIDFSAVGHYFVSLLEQLGYPTQIKTFPVNSASFGPLISDSRTAPQAWFGVGIPNYPAASQFLDGTYRYSCQSFVPNSTSNTNLEEFCDPQFDAAVRSAVAAEAAGSPTSSQLWANADKQLTDQAPDVDLVNPSTTDFVSRRVGNYQYNPQLGVILDQLWVR
jgi:YVTN family beta-propeller protein